MLSYFEGTSKEFFEKAIEEWMKLMDIYSELEPLYRKPIDKLREANNILSWFQMNYDVYRKFSNFSKVITDMETGKRIHVDPLFNIIYGASNIENIFENNMYIKDLIEGLPQLKGHLSSVTYLSKIKRKSNQLKITDLKNILNRFHLFSNQLKRVRKDKSPFLIEDEYDIQILLHSILRLLFDDVRKEEWTPSYAGGSSRIDLVLKKEGIIIEVKYAREKTREKEIGDQLIIDIEKYKQYPNVNTLICFIYNPENWIENPESLKDLLQQETEELSIDIIISPPVS